MAEAGLLDTLLKWAWAAVGVLMGIIWKKHNEEIADIKAGIKGVRTDMNENAKFLDGRIDAVEKGAVPILVYEQNRKEVREGQIAIYTRIGEISQSLARIEGKLDK